MYSFAVFTYWNAVHYDFRIVIEFNQNIYQLNKITLKDVAMNQTIFFQITIKLSIVKVLCKMIVFNKYLGTFDIIWSHMAALKHFVKQYLVTTKSITFILSIKLL